MAALAFDVIPAAAFCRVGQKGHAAFCGSLAYVQVDAFGIIRVRRAPGFAATVDPLDFELHALALTDPSGLGMGLRCSCLALQSLRWFLC